MQQLFGLFDYLWNAKKDKVLYIGSWVTDENSEAFQTDIKNSISFQDCFAQHSFSEEKNITFFSYKKKYFL